MNDETIIEEIIERRKKLILSEALDDEIREKVDSTMEPQYYRFPGSTVMVCMIAFADETYFLGSYQPFDKEKFNEEQSREFTKSNAINNLLYYLQSEKTVSYDLKTERNEYPNQNPFRRGTVRID